MQHEPHVGIFWLVPDDPHPPCLVTDMTRLSLAEPYGQVLTHPRGHYEVWSEWQKLGVTSLLRRGLPRAIYAHEYEAFPRGRVVCMPTEDQFVIYGDRLFQGEAAARALSALFHLMGRTICVRTDSHYVV